MKHRYEIVYWDDTTKECDTGVAVGESLQKVVAEIEDPREIVEVTLLESNVEE